MGLDVLELVMAMEGKFQVRIPDEAAARLLTVGQTRDELVRLLIEAGARDTPALRTRVWDGMVEIIKDQMGIAPQDVSPEARWVPDISDSG